MSNKFLVYLVNDLQWTPLPTFISSWPHIIFRICQMSKLSEIKMSCTICLPSFRLFVILATFSGSCAGSGASWFLLVHPQRDYNLPSGQTVGGPAWVLSFFQMQRDVHGPRSLFPVLCPCAVCPCRCSTQISGLCIVVWLGFGPGVSGFNLSLLLSLYSFHMPLSDVNQIVCWLSLRLVSQLQLPLCQYSFPFPYPFPFPVPA